MTAAPTVVRDTNRAEYPLGRVLGEGGQGRVHAVIGKPLAVKLLHAGTATVRERLGNEVARVRRLDLQGLPLARPLAPLAPPHVGYVMELLTDMVPLSRVVHPPRGTANVLPWYLETGGLNRRLRLLARLAEVLAALHGRGLSYGDMSPDNVFLSERLEASEVWLIDCDNIHAGVSPRSVYTPGYAAPELFQRNHQMGADTLTDAWSFATLAFETLAVLHPFDGDRVHDGDPRWEDIAFRGGLPWVDDPADLSNAAAGRGMPRSVVLSTQLRALAGECFGDSRLDRMKRPGVAAWADLLNKAADQTLTCPSCSGGYFLNLTCCPWCEAPRPEFVLVDIRLVDLEGSCGPKGPVGKRGSASDVIVARTTVQVGRTTTLVGRQVDMRTAAARTPVVELRLDGSRLLLAGKGDAELVLASGDRRQTLAGVTRDVKVDSLAGYWLEPARPAGLHRVVHFQRAPAPRSP